MKSQCLLFVFLLLLSAYMSGRSEARLQPSGFADSACGSALPGNSALPDFRPAKSASLQTLQPYSRQYGELPLSFEANRGQSDPQVLFLARTGNLALFLTAREAVMVFRSTGADPSLPIGKRGSSGDSSTAGVVRLRWLGSNSHCRIVGADQLPGTTNYLWGRNRARWKTSIPSFGKVQYCEVFPGTSLLFYGRAGRLEHDFVVKPGADPSKIKLRLDGADQLHIDRLGDLTIRSRGHELKLSKPYAYQDLSGTRTEIPVTYALSANNRIRFQIGRYDPAVPLVIDPTLVVEPVLSYATFLGGTRGEQVQAIAVDAAGSAYVSGVSFSSDFPTRNAAVNSGPGSFVAKINPAGSALVYSTYLPGRDRTYATAIAVDSAGNAFVTGSTASLDFPAVNAIQPSHGSPPWFDSDMASSSDAFILKLNPTGSSILFSTFLGGIRSDLGQSIALDPAGNIYIAGVTDSVNFPMHKALQGGFSGGLQDAFVAKIDSAYGLVYSTYIGGTGREISAFVTATRSGEACIAGATESTDLPMERALQPKNSGGGDVFVWRLDPTGSSLIFSTFLGGSLHDGASSITTDDSGIIYLAGATTSSDFPRINALQTRLNGRQDCFVAKLAPDGSSLVFSTYLGGTQDEGVTGIAVNKRGEIYLSGYTQSADFPLVKPFSSKLSGFSDAFLTKLSPSGKGMVYSSYLEGTEASRGIAVDPEGDVYLTGVPTYDFPVLNALQPRAVGNANAFVAKILERKKSYFAHFAAGQEGGFAVASELILVNLHPTKSADTNVEIRDGSGTLMTIDLNGTVVRGQIKLMIPPAGVARLHSGQLRPIQSGTLTVTSDRDFAGVLLFGGSPGLSGITESKPGTSFVVPVETAPGISTGLAFMALGTPQTLRLQLRNSMGTIIANCEFSLGSNSQLNRLVSELPWNPVPDFSRFRGVLSVAGTAEFATVAIRSSPGEIAAIPVQEDFTSSAASGSPLTSYFALFADGNAGAGSFIRSYLTMVGLSSQPASVAIELNDRDGNPMAVQLNDSLIQGRVEVGVPPGGSVTLATNGQGPIQTGSIVLRSTSPVAASILLEGSQGVAALGENKPLRTFTAPIEITPSVNTGIALMGVDKEQQIVLELRDRNGAVLAGSTVTLPTKAQVIKFITEVEWDQPVDFTDFLGTLTARGSSMFAASAVRVSPGAFAVLPVIER